MSADGHCQRTCSCCAYLISVGFVVLIYWAILQPHQIRATVDTATLSNLTVVSNTSSTSSPATVSYHVAVNLTLYNPSKRVGIYYDTLTAQLLYRGALLSAAPAAVSASPAVFYQRRRTAQLVGLVFDAVEGGGVALPDGLAAQLQTEAAGAARALGLELDLALSVRYSFGKIRQKPRVWCALAVPVPTAPGGVGVLGSGGRCSVKY